MRWSRAAKVPSRSGGAGWAGRSAGGLAGADLAGDHAGARSLMHQEIRATARRGRVSVQHAGAKARPKGIRVKPCGPAGGRSVGLAKTVDGIWACELLPRLHHPVFSNTVARSAQQSGGPDRLHHRQHQQDRAIFEINKGVNRNENVEVNLLVPRVIGGFPTQNMIYIADGPSDVPSFSLVNSKEEDPGCLRFPGTPTTTAPQTRRAGAGEQHRRSRLRRRQPRRPMATTDHQTDSRDVRDRERVFSSYGGAPGHKVEFRGWLNNGNRTGWCLCLSRSSRTPGDVVRSRRLALPVRHICHPRSIIAGARPSPTQALTEYERLSVAALSGPSRALLTTPPGATSTVWPRRTVS